MGWFGRDKKASRRSRSTDDPVAVALAEAAEQPFVPQVDFEELGLPVLAELPGLFDVAESSEVAGFDTVVLLADEIHAWIDPPTSGLEIVLAEQWGIAEAYAEDREVLYLRTRLDLEDVKAAVVRSVVEVNQRPRAAEGGEEEPSEELLLSLVEAVLPELEAAGFVRQAGPEPTRYFHRSAEDGIVQSLSLHTGLGTRDGISMRSLVEFWVAVHVPGVKEMPGPPEDLNLLAPVHCTFLEYLPAQPTPDQVRAVWAEKVLPMLETTAQRERLSAWVAADPSRVGPPIDWPGWALALVGWGRQEEARGVLVALRQRHKGLMSDPKAVQAAELIGG